MCILLLLLLFLFILQTTPLRTASRYVWIFPPPPVSPVKRGTCDHKQTQILQQSVQCKFEHTFELNHSTPRGAELPRADFMPVLRKEGKLGTSDLQLMAYNLRRSASWKGSADPFITNRPRAARGRLII